MTRPFFRLLGDSTNSSTSSSPDEISDTAAPVDSDFVVILAALLCALICVLGLVSVARCAWLRRLSSSAPPPPAANKGVRKKVLRSLPKETLTPETSGKFSECAICLAELAAGEEIRVLPQCGHSFHVACIDRWLVSHSSCPSCRKILVVARCEKCGSLPGSSSRLKEGEDDVNRFLP